MADESTTRAKAPEEPVEERFTAEELAERAREIGCDRHALAGALAGQTKKTFTVSEARTLVNRFRTRKVG